jgi:type II secretory pathway pseudopilin PulG
MKNSQSFARAFTLVEALVAISIISLAVASPLLTASQALTATRIARDELTASYLAQEGIEYVRAMRDDAFLAAHKVGGTTVSETGWSNFLTFIAPCSSSTQSCALDATKSVGVGTNSALEVCTNLACTTKPLYLDNGVYRKSTSPGTLTRFTRSLRVINVTATEKIASSTVHWSDRGKSYSITITDHLTPWQ